MPNNFYKETIRYFNGIFYFQACPNYASSPRITRTRNPAWKFSGDNMIEFLYNCCYVSFHTLLMFDALYFSVIMKALRNGWKLEIQECSDPKCCFLWDFQRMPVLLHGVFHLRGKILVSY